MFDGLQGKRVSIRLAYEIPANLKGTVARWDGGGIVYLSDVDGLEGTVRVNVAHVAFVVVLP